MDTTNLRQIAGGTVIKQADRSSTMSFILQDAIGREVDLDGQTAQVALYTLKGKYWEITSRVQGSIVSFSLPGNLSEDDYILDISVAGYVFPSDRDFIIRVVKGFRDLPNTERAERAKQTFEEIRDGVEKESEKRLEGQLEKIDEKSESTIQAIEKDGQEYIKLIGTNKDNAIAEIEAKRQSSLQEINKKAESISQDTLSKVNQAIKDKVDKEEGKGLSDNNFTDEYKSKVDKVDELPIEIDVKSDGTITTKYINNRSSDAFGVRNALNDKVDKEVGKELSDNNFTNYYKDKLDNLDENLDLKADKEDVKSQVQEVKKLIFDNTVRYQDDMIYTLDTILEGREVKIKPKEIGKLVKNDFLKVQVDTDVYKVRIKATNKGIILFYSLSDEDLRYAIHVSPNISDYQINFGKKVKGEMIFSTVSMPEDKVSIIREEGLWE